MFFKTLFSFMAALLYAQSVYGVSIISKQEWGGRPATSKSNLSNDSNYVIIHHTAGVYCSNRTTCSQEMRNIQDYHQLTLGWADIGYNFLIGGDGDIYEGRGWNTLGAHASNWNSKSLGISFLGNYNNITPNAAQITAAKSLLADAVSRSQIKSNYILYGHRQIRPTECPGTFLWNEIKTWPHWKA